MYECRLHASEYEYVEAALDAKLCAATRLSVAG